MFNPLTILLGVVTIANAILAISEGYSYPQPPLQFDEPSTSPPPLYLPPPPFNDDIPQVVPTYLPPNVYPPVGSPPQQDILPPLDDTVVISPPGSQYGPPTARQAPLHVFNMSCLEPNSGLGFFRTLLRPTSSSRVFPVIETSSPDCTVAPSGMDLFRIDLEGPRMVDCGVRSCGTRMCLILRMATVPGLKLVDDPLITLQCIPQETVVSHTKHLRLNAQSEQGRSGARSVAVASGGNQRRFETQLTLLRKSSSGGSFDQPILQGSAVRLGDELLLRCSVRDGDGWRYSRMGSVVVRSASSQRSIFLVDENGCRSPSVRNICPNHPQQINPLMVQLPFRAFLFQGAAPADDLLLSVRMSGCLRPRDCYQKACDDGNKTRTARAVANFTGGNEEADVVAEFQFRVLPKEFPEEVHGYDSAKSPAMWPFVFLMILSVLLVFMMIILMLKSARQRIYL